MLSNWTFLVIKAGVKPAQEIQIVRETVTMVRKKIGPVADSDFSAGALPIGISRYSTM
jgi:hypothetical protein